MANAKETIADIRKEAEAKFRELIEAWMQRRSTFQTTLGAMQAFNTVFDRLEAAHKREIDVLKQRCAELNAEIAAKDEVIKRLNDAIAEEQRRKMATTENPSAVGNAAKLREAVIKTQSVIAKCMDILNKIPECGYNGLVDDAADELCDLREEYVKSALAMPPRNCDKYSHDQALRIWSAEPDDQMNGCFDDWLYAPATEKEGGAK